MGLVNPEYGSTLWKGEKEELRVSSMPSPRILMRMNISLSLASIIDNGK